MSEFDVRDQIKNIRNKKQRPRRAVVSWMRRSPSWYRETIALEWERQTGEDWLNLIQAAAA